MNVAGDTDHPEMLSKVKERDDKKAGERKRGGEKAEGMTIQALERMWSWIFRFVGKEVV